MGSAGWRSLFLQSTGKRVVVLRPLFRQSQLPTFRLPMTTIGNVALIIFRVTTEIAKHRISRQQMKLLLGALVLFVFALPLQGQETDRSKLDQNIYYRALVAMLGARARDNAEGDARDPLRRVIIMRDIQLNDGFPTRVGDVEIEYLDSADLRLRHRSMKHEIPVFVMRPIRSEGNRLVVGFTRYWFSATKKSDQMSMEGGYNVALVYDCVRKEFVVENTMLWGI